jgi:hypothetical protein
MFSGIFNNTVNKISFEDIQYATKNKIQYIIINTLPSDDQNCLILNTVPHAMEEKVINDLLSQYLLRDKIIIVYGKNTNDDTVEKKCRQFMSLGFIDVYAYLGGLFEWLLLQDIYGEDEFPTTTCVLDILKYKSQSIFS